MALRHYSGSGYRQMPPDWPGQLHTRPVHPHTTPETGMAAPGGVKSSSGNHGQELGECPRCWGKHLAYILLFNHFNILAKYCYPQIGVYPKFTQIRNGYNSVFEVLTFLSWGCVYVSLYIYIYGQRNRESCSPTSACLREFYNIQEIQPRTPGSLPQRITMRLSLQKKPEKFTFHKQNT